MQMKLPFAVEPRLKRGVFWKRVVPRMKMTIEGRPDLTMRARTTVCPVIPPNALLHFDVELVEISEAGGWMKRLASIAKALPYWQQGDEELELRVKSATQLMH